MNNAADRYDYLLDRANMVDPRLGELLPDSAVAAGLAALAVIIAMGIYYGAIDLVEAEDGTSYVVDVNLTPYWGQGGEDLRILKHLRAGLR